MTLFDRLFGRKIAAPGSRRQSGVAATAPSESAEPNNDGMPPKCPGNPGKVTGGRITFTGSDRSWTETFNVVQIAASVLRSRGHDVVEHKGWLELRSSGFVLQPQMVEIQLHDNGVQTLTTVDVSHPQLIPGGLFEYQHSTGDDVVGAVKAGFESWESVDLAVLLDALRARPEKCSMWEMKFPAKGDTPERTRRAVLGSVAWFAAARGGDEQQLYRERQGGRRACLLYMLLPHPQLRGLSSAARGRRVLRHSFLCRA